MIYTLFDAGGPALYAAFAAAGALAVGVWYRFDLSAKKARGAELRALADQDSVSYAESYAECGLQIPKLCIAMPGGSSARTRSCSHYLRFGSAVSMECVAYAALDPGVAIGASKSRVVTVWATPFPVPDFKVSTLLNQAVFDRGGEVEQALELHHQCKGLTLAHFRSSYPDLARFLQAHYDNRLSAPRWGVQVYEGWLFLYQESTSALSYTVLKEYAEFLRSLQPPAD